MNSAAAFFMHIEVQKVITFGIVFYTGLETHRTVTVEREIFARGKFSPISPCKSSGEN